MAQHRQFPMKELTCCAHSSLILSSILPWMFSFFVWFIEFGKFWILSCNFCWISYIDFSLCAARLSLFADFHFFSYYSRYFGFAVCFIKCKTCLFFSFLCDSFRFPTFYTSIPVICCVCEYFSSFWTIVLPSPGRSFVVLSFLFVSNNDRCSKLCGNWMPRTYRILEYSSWM